MARSRKQTRRLAKRAVPPPPPPPPQPPPWPVPPWTPLASNWPTDCSNAVTPGWPVPPPLPLLKRFGATSAAPRFYHHGDVPRLKSVRTTSRYGWVPDVPDHRDQLYSAPMATTLPERINLAGACPPVYDQGQLGSCTANAIGAAIQFERMRQQLPAAAKVPSRLFIYYNERELENTVRSDSGAQIRDGIKTIASLGACFEGNAKGEWPYIPSRFAVAPPKPCYGAASLDRAVGYSRLTPDLTQLKGCLASGYPFVFGFTVYESFESASVAKSGVLDMPTAGERVVGGHAVMCVGYDESSQRFLIRNSWGAKWGIAGYFTMPYAYLLSSTLCDDFWTIRLVS